MFSVIKRCWPALLAGGSLLCSPVPANAQSESEIEARALQGPWARNVIFMVPDGMGLPDVTAARIFKNGPNGRPLAFETLPIIGYQRTHAADSTVTDSAAAASAWAMGEKYSNAVVSCRDSDYDRICDEPVGRTILEMARDKGKATGLVATATITHATPAAFGSHVHIRWCETEIARQYIEGRIDVLLGGGIGPDITGPDSCENTSPLSREQIIDTARLRLGYRYVQTKKELIKAVLGGADRLLGLFAAGGKTAETFRVDPAVPYPAEEPKLSEMTLAALKVLEKDPDGFFLLVEGSQVDWKNHDHDSAGQIAEVLAFEEAVGVILSWVDAVPARRDETLIIVVPDHETGGFAVNGPFDGLSKKGDIVEGAWTTGSHTGTDVLVWSQGPGSEYLGRALDNTHIHKVMRYFMK